MQRIKTYRYKARNIGGDNAFAKLRYATGGTFQVATGGPGYTVSTPIGFNDGSQIFANFGSTPGLSLLAQQFLNYRISAIKMKHTLWTSQSSDPVVFFTQAAADALLLLGVPNAANLPEARWAKYVVCNPTSAGSRPSKLSSYYSVNKVVGPDITTKTDLDYVGSLKTTAPYWDTVPPETPELQTGAYTMSGVAPIGNQTLTVKTEVTLYCKFYGRRTLTQ